MVCNVKSDNSGTLNGGHYTSPFLTTVSRSDYVVLLITFGGMLFAGLTVLTVMIRQLKPDQVLKLGED